MSGTRRPAHRTRQPERRARAARVARVVRRRRQPTRPAHRVRRHRQPGRPTTHRAPRPAPEERPRRAHQAQHPARPARAEPEARAPRSRQERRQPRGLRRPVWALSASVVVVGLLFVVGFPFHTYLQQRDSISATESQVQRLARDNAALRGEVRRLNTDSELERLARQEYGLVAPGDQAYTLLPLAPGQKPLAGPERKGSGLSAGAQAPPAGGQPGPGPAPGFWQRMLDELSF